MPPLQLNRSPMIFEILWSMFELTVAGYLVGLGFWVAEWVLHKFTGR